MCLVLDAKIRRARITGEVESDEFDLTTTGIPPISRWVNFRGVAPAFEFTRPQLDALLGKRVDDLTVAELHGGRLAAWHYITGVIREWTADYTTGELTFTGVSVGPFETHPNDAREP